MGAVGGWGGEVEAAKADGRKEERAAFRRGAEIWYWAVRRRMAVGAASEGARSWRQCSISFPNRNAHIFGSIRTACLLTPVWYTLARMLPRSDFRCASTPARYSMSYLAIILISRIRDSPCTTLPQSSR